MDAEKIISPVDSGKFGWSTGKIISPVDKERQFLQWLVLIKCLSREDNFLFFQGSIQFPIPVSTSFLLRSFRVIKS